MYTRSDASVTSFYECRYDYLPSTGGAEGGDWTSVRFDISTIADTAFSRPGTAGCPSGDKTLLQNAADSNYVLGTNDQFPMPPGGAGLIFSLNMGDSSISDAGLSGYFDAVVVKLQGEDARVFDLEP